MTLYVASHYKNSPNDLQLMADAPAHHLFVLLGMYFLTSYWLWWLKLSILWNWLQFASWRTLGMRSCFSFFNVHICRSRRWVKKSPARYFMRSTGQIILFLAGTLFVSTFSISCICFITLVWQLCKSLTINQWKFRLITKGYNSLRAAHLCFLKVDILSTYKAVGCEVLFWQ